MYQIEPVAPLTEDEHLGLIKVKINEHESAGDWKGAREWKLALSAHITSRTDPVTMKVTPTPNEAVVLDKLAAERAAAHAVQAQADSLAKDAALLLKHERSPEGKAEAAEAARAVARAEARARLAEWEAANPHEPFGGPRDPSLPPLPPSGLGRN